MKKRILSLVAALALAATVVTPANAAATLTTTTDESNGVKFISSDITDDGKDVVNSIVDKLSSTAKSANGDLKPSGAPNAKANVVTGSAKDNLMDNGIKPAVKEFVKVSKKRSDPDPTKRKAEAGKCGVESLRQIYYFNLTADQPGDVTFKIDQDENGKAQDGDSYAIILHYTGNAADEDGITAQYCKISSAGKVTAHFNSYSPVGIIATTSHSAQELVNTYSHSAGSDAGNAAATTTPAVTAPVVDPNAAVAAPVDGAAAAAGTTAANGKGAASPKTSDNAYAMYLILAVAAVAGTTLVATKKTR